MTQQQEAVQHVAELVDRAKISMLTTLTSDGRHVSRPMALQEVEFDGDLWFLVDDTSDKVQQIQEHPPVNVSFANDKSAPLKTWFSDGLDTPGLALIKVHVETAEYWESPSSKVVQMIGAARAAATDDPDKFPSTNETVVL